MRSCWSRAYAKPAAAGVPTVLADAPSPSDFGRLAHAGTPPLLRALVHRHQRVQQPDHVHDEQREEHGLFLMVKGSEMSDFGTA